jgi:hypothetical protein
MWIAIGIIAVMIVVGVLVVVLLKSQSHSEEVVVDNDDRDETVSDPNEDHDEDETVNDQNEDHDEDETVNDPNEDVSDYDSSGCPPGLRLGADKTRPNMCYGVVPKVPYTDEHWSGVTVGRRESSIDNDCNRFSNCHGFYTCVDCAEWPNSSVRRNEGYQSPIFRDVYYMMSRRPSTSSAEYNTIPNGARMWVRPV